MFVHCTILYGNQSSCYTIPLILQFVLHSTLHIMQSLRPHCDFEKGLLFCMFRFIELLAFSITLIGILFLFAAFCMRFFNSDSGVVSTNMKLLYFQFLLNQLFFLMFLVNALFRFLIKFWNKFTSMLNSLSFHFIKLL